MEDVKEGLFFNWGNDPFGGSYHFYKTGYNNESVMKTMRQPWKDEKVFIVGEGYSNFTGWVEGALQTSENMLKEKFGREKSLEKCYTGY